MSTTVLERLELTVEDIEIGCECFLGMTCDRAATCIVRFGCGCIRFNCTDCIAAHLVYLSGNIGRIGYCRQCGKRTAVFKVSDVIVSIDPI